MSRTQNAGESTGQTLSKILATLQHLLILEAARAGLSKAQARELAGVGDTRVGKIWKSIKKSLKE